MYLGIDIGGTKTLIATIDDNGAIIEQCKFSTPKVYPEFLKELAINVAKLSTEGIAATGVAVPGKLDREHGRAHCSFFCRY
jgi:predicted NBD/HSP70 family sugar kinase